MINMCASRIAIIIGQDLFALLLYHVLRGVDTLFCIKSKPPFVLRDSLQPKVTNLRTSKSTRTSEEVYVSE